MNISFRRIIAVASALSIAVSALTFTAADAAFITSGEVQLLEAPSFSGASFDVPELKRVTDSDGERLVPVTTYTASDEVFLSDEGFPASFDLRDEGVMSSVKNQGSNGTCWAFAASASAESGLTDSLPHIDLSELHTAYYTYYGGESIDIGDVTNEEIIDYGGNRDVAVNLWAQWKGPVAESVMPYEDIGILDDTEVVEELYTRADYHLENAYMYDYDKGRSNSESVNNLTKQFVYGGNSVCISYYSSNSTAYNYEEYAAYCTEKPKNANHCVVIAGWDDNFPASAFSEYEGSVPQNDGAWLVKNSWGANLGDFGYMWISYEDTSLCEFTVFDVTSNENYSSLYSHDSFVPIQTMSAGEDTEEKYPSYMANIFTADENEQIEAVSTYMRNADTEYEITVYTELEDVSDPTSGRPSAVTSGVSNLNGYITIELDEAVEVTEGEAFAVEVKMYSPESNFVIPIESCLFLQDYETQEKTVLGGYTTYEQMKQYTAENQSLFSEDGVTWYDVTDEPYVYTEDEKNELILSVLEALEEDGESQEVIEETALLYAQLFSTGDVMVEMGNIAVKAFANPAGVVDFSHISGAVPSDEAVSLSATQGGTIYYSVNDGEYTEYTAPIKITEKSHISAYSEDYPVYVTERDYYPETAEFNSLGYTFRISNSAASLEYAQRINESFYIINVDETTEQIRICPITGAEVIMDGTALANNIPGEKITIDKGRNVFTFELSEENSLSNTVTLVINRGVQNGDVNADGAVDPVDATQILIHYSYISMNGGGVLDASQLIFADYDDSGEVDSVDATGILMDYSYSSMS